MSTATPSRPSKPRRSASRQRSTRQAPIVASIDPIKVLRRHMWGIAAAAVLGGALGVAAHFLLMRYMPMYKGEALFEVRPALESSSQIGAQDFGRDELATRVATTETVLLLSREVLTRAASNPDIRQHTQWHKDFLLPDGTYSIEDAVDALEESVKAAPMRGTNLFALTWSTGNKSDVPIVLNAITRAYLEQRKAQDEATYVENVRVFQGQLEQTQRELEDLTQDIKTYITTNGITTLTDSRFSQESYRMQELTDKLGDAVQGLSLAQMAYVQTAKKIEGTIEPTFDDELMAERDPSVQAHIQGVLGLKTELRRVLDRYQPDHHIVVAIEQRLSAAELERDAKLNEIMERNLQARAKELESEIERIQSVIEATEEEAEKADAELRELAASHSQFEAMESRRRNLEQRRDDEMGLIKEVQLMRLRADQSRVRAVRAATTPREVAFPKIAMIAPLGVFLLTGLTVGIFFLRELTDQRVKGASDLGIIPGANVLGVIPELEEDPTNIDSAELVVRRHPNSVLAESYRQACTPISRMMQRAGYQLLLLLGGLPGAGTTTAVTNLAAVASAAGRRVVAVDANFRRPRLATAFGADDEGPGFGDLLAGDATIDEAVKNTEYGVHVIHAGTPGSRIFERLSTGAMDSLLAELRTRYDMVLFDAPPAVVAGDAMNLASKVDAAVLIVRANHEQRGLVARLLRQLNDARCNPLGILLNRPRGTAGGYFKKNYATMAEYTAKPGK